MKWAVSVLVVCELDDEEVPIDKQADFAYALGQRMEDDATDRLDQERRDLLDDDVTVDVQGIGFDVVES